MLSTLNDLAGAVVDVDRLKERAKTIGRRIYAPKRLGVGFFGAAIAPSVDEIFDGVVNFYVVHIKRPRRCGRREGATTDRRAFP